MDRQDLQHPQTPLLPLVIEVDEFGGSSPQTQLSKYIDTSPSIRQGDFDIQADARSEHIQEHVLPSAKWHYDRIGPLDFTANLSPSPTSHSKQSTSMSKILGGVSNITHPLTKRITHLTRKSGFHGWRMGVLLGCCMSMFVLCCNIAIIIVGARASYNADGISDIVIGDEATVSRWNTAFHVLINALSTMLLAGSNYTMQVLCSPSREDIDAAHAKGEWLDIGLLSPRNLRTIPRKRKLLWYTLGLSSIPLHLFYNAAIFKVVTSSDYNIVTLDISSDEWNRINSTIDVSTSTNGGYWNMSNNRWNDVYNNQYLSVHGDLFLAIDRVAFDTDWSQMDLTIPETMSRCLNMNTTGNLTYLKKLTSESPVWIRYEVKLNDNQFDLINVSAHVAGAASQKRQSPPSRVQASLHFLLVVAIFNLMKLVVMAYILVTDRSAYVVTLGDAIASFLQCSDPHTYGKCLLGREELLVTMGHPPHHPISSPEEKENLESRTRGLWLPQPRPYFFAVHRMSKIAYTMLFLIVILLLCLAPIYTGANGTWDWGTASTDDLSLSANHTTVAATLWNAWLANAPQLLLSFCYLNVNMICTSMAGAEEWNNLASTKKGLRVTKPYGYQRSTYFLQLPYRWSVPLIVSSGTLHWLLSQTFFLVRVDFFDRHSQMIETASKSTCGFSSLSLFVFLSGLILLLGTIGFVGFRKISMKLPVVASCSLAISAACHPSPNEVEPHLALVQWGVTEHEVVRGFCHCSISSKPVKVPVIGIAHR